MSSAQYNLGRVVGPALAGVVIDLGGYAWALGINAASFLAVVLCVLTTIRIPPPTPPPEGETLWRSIGDRLRASCAAIAACASASARCASTRSSPRRSSRSFPRWPRRCSTRVDAARRSSSPRRASARSRWRSRSARSSTRFGIRRVLVADARAPAALARGVRVRARARVLGAGAALRRRVLYLGALSSFIDDRAAARAARDPRAGARRVHVILGSLYPLGAVVQGKIADYDRAARDDVRRGGAHGGRAARRARSSDRASPPRSTRPRRRRVIPRRSRRRCPSRFRRMAVVEIERRGTTAILTLNRPEARNAISPEVSQAMVGHPRRDRGRRRAARASCSTGAGDVFSAGADLKVVAQGRGMDIARGKGGFAGVVTPRLPEAAHRRGQRPRARRRLRDRAVVRPRGRGRHRALRHPRSEARADGRGGRADPAPQAGAARDRARARDDRRPDRRRPRARSSGS